MNFKEIEVSFRKAFGEPIRNVNLFRFLTTDHYKVQIEEIRTEEDKDKRGELKKLLGSITPSGLFKDALKDDNLVRHSGYICLDIDQQDNEYTAQSIKDVCCSLSQVAFCAYSASGNGVFALVKIDPNEHHRSFEYLQHWFKDDLGIIVDQQCKNLARIRFCTYDPDYYLNEDPAELSVGDWQAPKEIHEWDGAPENKGSYDDFSTYIENFKHDFHEGNRNRFAYHKAQQAREKFGLSKHDCFGVLKNLACTGFSVREIEQAVRSAYRT